MSLINLNALSLALGTELFSNLDLSIERGDRLGVIAANGRGKSSLLKCLAGRLDPSSGAITMARNLKIGLMEQDLPTDSLSPGFADMVAGGHCRGQSRLGALACRSAARRAWCARRPA